MSIWHYVLLWTYFYNVHTVILIFVAIFMTFRPLYVPALFKNEDNCLNIINSVNNYNTSTQKYRQILSMFENLKGILYSMISVVYIYYNVMSNLNIGYLYGLCVEWKFCWFHSEEIYTNFRLLITDFKIKS